MLFLHFVEQFFARAPVKICGNSRSCNAAHRTKDTMSMLCHKKLQKKKPSGWLPKGFTLCKSSVCKPSSVLNGYLSTAVVTDSLQRIRRDAEQAFDLISCTEWGLHARVVTKACVGSYPAFPPLQRQALRYISVALSLKSPSQAVSLHSCSVVLGLSS